MTSTHHTIQTDQAPEAIGPYSQAVVMPALGLVFTSGQIGLDPATGALVGGGIEEEARQVMKNLAGLLKAAGSGFDRVVKTTVFLIDMADFARFNSVYGEWLGTTLPARSTVAVAALPKGARVEVDLVAAVPVPGTMGLDH